MSKKYETLDEYLDDLDKIKEGIARETEGMTEAEVLAYFASAKRELEQTTGIKLRLGKEPTTRAAGRSNRTTPRPRGRRTSRR